MTDNGRLVIWRIVLVLSIIGAINWGLVGFFNWNLVDAIFGGDTRLDTTVASRIVYSLVGISGLMLAVLAANRARGRIPARAAGVTP